MDQYFVKYVAHYKYYMTHFKVLYVGFMFHFVLHFVRIVTKWVSCIWNYVYDLNNKCIIYDNAVMTIKGIN